MSANGRWNLIRRLKVKHNFKAGLTAEVIKKYTNLIKKYLEVPNRIPEVRNHKRALP